MQQHSVLCNAEVQHYVMQTEVQQFTATEILKLLFENIGYWRVQTGFGWKSSLKMLVTTGFIQVWETKFKNFSRIFKSTKNSLLLQEQKLPHGSYQPFTAKFMNFSDYFFYKMQDQLWLLTHPLTFNLPPMTHVPPLFHRSNDKGLPIMIIINTSQSVKLSS